MITKFPLVNLLYPHMDMVAGATFQVVLVKIGQEGLGHALMRSTCSTVHELPQYNAGQCDLLHHPLILDPTAIVVPLLTHLKKHANPNRETADAS